MISDLELDCYAKFERRLRWLDRLLEGAIDRQRAEGRWRGDDDLRGVHTSAAQAAGVLAGRALTRPAERDELEQPDLVSECFALDPFERFVLLLALAPELDSRYAAVFGYLNDDVNARLPTVALALDLYCGAGLQTVPLRRALQPQATLVRYRLIRLRPPVAGASLLRAGLAVDEWLIGRLFGYETEEQPLIAHGAPGVPADSRQLFGVQVVSGRDSRAALEHALAQFGKPGIELALDPAGNPGEAVLLAARQARLDDCALVISGRELEEAGPAVVRLVGELAGAGDAVAVLDDPDRPSALPDGWPRVSLPPITTAGRRERWRLGLTAAGVAAEPGAAEAVADAHPVPLARIDAAVERLAAARHPAVTPRELQRATSAAARHQLGGLARRVPGGRCFGDLVLPPATIAQLREIAAAITQRPRVLEEWGYGRHAGGSGMHLLFGGPSGTGKTLAASVIAEEAGYALYAIDLATVVDKYLGETEKQLDRVFTEATAAGAMLLFDEADALFGQRAEVHDARDRYANVEIAYLLQRLDAHEGVTILATNLPHHLDQAFARRLHHRVEFPMPDRHLRASLWRAVLPREVPCAADLDLELLAERFELSGGAIRNAALTAGYLAASEREPLSQAHAVRAIARELEKVGRPPTRAEFGELHSLLSLP